MKTTCMALILGGATLAQAGEFKFEKPEKLQADGKAIDVRSDMSYAGPLVGDVNGDGKMDLVVTTIRGVFLYFENAAEEANTAPVLKSKGYLQSEGKSLKLHNW